jgi:hypothetical protein
MKAMNHLSTVAIVVAALLIPISARAAEQKVEFSSRKLDVPGNPNKEGRSITVEIGNGGSITFDAPVAQRAPIEKSSPAHAIRWQLVAFECGNGGTKTFLIPAAQQTATEERSAVQPKSQSVNSIGRPSNEAQANSPQFREEHPGSDRIAISSEEAKAKAERIMKQMDKLKENVVWAASPRAREEFPELQRVPFSIEEQQATAERIKKQIDKLKENIAWAASPRTREEFPELQRVPFSIEEQQAKTERIKKQMDKLKENVAWAASPRVREEFPELRFVREPEVFGHGEQPKPTTGYVNAK